MSNKFFSISDEKFVGSFHHGLGIIEIKISSEAHALFENPTLIQKYKNDEHKTLKLLLELSCIIHERMHYIDTFGTLAGISLYTSRLESLKNFRQAAIDLIKNKIPWDLPLSKMAKIEGQPDSLRKLARRAKASRYGQDLFLAPFSQFAVFGQTSEPWEELPFESFGSDELATIPAFPRSIGVQDKDGQIYPATIYFPIGYEAVIEGVAHALSRTFINAKFPDIPNDFLVLYGKKNVIQSDLCQKDCLEKVASTSDIYSATDLMISKFLRSYEIHSFERGLVLKVSDIALSSSVIKIEDISQKSTAVKFSNPGFSMIECLESIIIDDKKNICLEYPKSITERYEFILKKFSEGGDWNTVENRENPYLSLEIWESFIAQNVTVPLLKKRVESNHSCFTKEDQIIELLFDKKLPLIEVVNEQIKFENIPTEVINAWADYMFLLEINEQIFADCDLIRCPKAHELLPGMKSIDFSKGGLCEVHKKMGCGSWASDGTNYFPPCHFTKALKMYGFIP